MKERLKDSMVHRSGFGQRMPDGSIVWSHQGEKKVKQ